MSVAIEDMIVGLASAGWVRLHANVWRAPDGRLFRGPALAYHAMMGLPWPPPRTAE